MSPDVCFGIMFDRALKDQFTSL